MKKTTKKCQIITLPIKKMFIYPTDSSNYKRLWLAVIIQAIEDITTTSIKREDNIAKQQAFTWFRNNSLDYQEVCENANVNHEWLRTKIRNSSPSQLRILINEYRRLV